MELLTSPASPFVRKVRVLIREAGLEEAVTERVVKTTPLNSAPEILSANPTGKIPALRRADGPALFDSRVICRYLDAHADAGLYPQSRVWEVLTLEALADAIMEAAATIVYDRRFRAADAQAATWADAQLGKITRALDALENRWMSHLNGPVDAAQIATACALGYLDFRHPDLDWRSARPALSAWNDRFSTRDSMAATTPS